MTQVEAAQRKRAGRIARWCSRAFVVAGGTIAGTAAVCAISTAGASAEPADPVAAGPAQPSISVEDASGADRLAPVTNNAVDGLSDATQGCADLIGDASGAVTHAAAHGLDPERGVADETAQPDSEQAGAGKHRPSEEPGSHQEAGQDTDEHAGVDQDTTGRAASKPRVHRQHRPIERVVDQDTAERVSSTIRDFTHDAVYEPIRKTAGSLEHIMRKPQDTRQVIEHNAGPERELDNFGTSMWDALHPHGDDAGLSKTPQHPGEQDDQASGDWQRADGADVDAAPRMLAAPAPPAPAPVIVDEGLNKGPSQPKLNRVGGAVQDHAKHADQDEQAPLPAAPSGVPMAPATGPVTPAGPGGHLDGLLFGVVTGPAGAIEPGVLGTVRAGSGYLPTEPGSAPGVTPD